MHVLEDIDFERILGGFGEGFGRPKSLMFAVFFVIFSMQNLECNLEGPKIEKNANKSDHPLIIPSVWRSVRAWGEGKRMGGRQLGRHSGMNPWPAILALLLSNAFLELGPSIWHARHPFGRRRRCCAQTAAPEGKKAKRR